MSGRLNRRWRPSLALVVVLTLAAVILTPGLTLLAMRIGLPDLRYRYVVVALVIVVALTTLALAWLFWRILYQPIMAMAAQAAQIGRGSSDSLVPLPHYGTREVALLGEAILSMGRNLQGREAVLRSYADHATHELKSPLTALRGGIELLDGDLPPEDRSRLLARMAEAANRMTALLDAQRALSRARNPTMSGQTAITALLPDLRREHPKLEITLSGDQDYPLSPEGMRLVLGHLLGNAARAGATHVRLIAEPDRLIVGDDGPGVSEGNRDRIFDPFFTTQRSDGGTGMGLPITRRLLEAHDATIRLLDPQPGTTGARFEIGF